ncbi:murein L,D-transpeptidase family protein [Psychrobacter sp. GP33]|uniref:L,D-transpeptidase family protein n=1 Tax=Psychrobacter sp. GP33 TaxID=2758709 RepID=UPI002174EB6F|nr:L,D-transpeptidase family protein [Psychrobacter sp. GP33]
MNMSVSATNNNVNHISTTQNKVTTSMQIIADTPIIDKVFVDKSERRLQLLSGNEVIKSYHVALGGNPIGHKQRQGDKRTPIGSYTLDYKNEKSKFYRSIHISYPNAADKARAKALGISAGGDIMIHGQQNGKGALTVDTQKLDWTEGCIAVTNAEMDEIMAAVKLGTSIEIVE